jgi:lipoprotein-anchoring transpeptidase ErfK/SrfK
MKNIKKILLWIVLLLPYLALFFVWQIHKREINKVANSTFIIISKEEMTLNVYNYKGKNIARYPVACGKNLGNKEKVGDMKTPEGVFHVSDIHNASHWSHDFGDGKGEIAGAYGPYFIRLLTPGHSGIGIHGTHNNNSIGTRATEGCIRIKNEDLRKLVKQVRIGDVVVISPSKDDVETTETKKEEHTN